MEFDAVKLSWSVRDSAAAARLRLSRIASHHSFHLQLTFTDTIFTRHIASADSK